jgi:hypothetical protein
MYRVIVSPCPALFKAGARIEVQKGDNAMSSHFTSFTPDAMRAFGQALSAGAAARHEFVTNLFASSNRDRHKAESERRQTAAQAADARRLFVSELQSGVHALRTRFALDRRDMAADFQQMAGELNAAREAFHDRAGFRPRAARSKQAAPSHSTPGHSATSHAASAHSEPTHPESSKPPQGEKSEHFKKRHG